LPTTNRRSSTQEEALKLYKYRYDPEYQFQKKKSKNEFSLGSIKMAFKKMMGKKDQQQ
jgi:hypothetical protein